MTCIDVQRRIGPGATARAWLGGALVGLAVAGSGCERSGVAPEAAPETAPETVIARPPEARPPLNEPWFEDVTAASGVDFEHRSGFDGGRRLFPEIIGGGVALVDLDGDGRLDVYFVQSGRVPGVDGAAGDDPADRPRNRVYRNLGDFRFEDVTGRWGGGDAGYGMGVATGDVDGDGDVDLCVTNLGRNVLLLNRSEDASRAASAGRLEDVSAASGADHGGWGASATFLHADDDGALDLFVTNYVEWDPASEIDCSTRAGLPDYCSPNSYAAPAPDVLLLGRGDGTFVDHSVGSGLRAAFGNGLGVVAADFDDDGRADLFVANDQLNDQFWRNETEPGGPVRFRDVAMAVGCAVDGNGRAKAGMGVEARDIDADGDLDLLVVNLQSESDTLFRNEGGWFVDATARAGLAGPSRAFTRFGVGMHDFDCDGHLDLYQANGRVTMPDDAAAGGDPYAEPNLLLVGTEDGTFVAAGSAGGADDFADGTADPRVLTSRGAAFGDLDDDGRIDVVIVNRDGPATILRNVAPRSGRWIGLDVRDAAGAPAIGAICRIHDGERRLRRDVRTGSSYLAANDPRIHVGLGPRAEDARVQRVDVRWPDGTEETFGPFELDRYHALRRGSGRAAKLPG